MVEAEHNGRCVCMRKCELMCENDMAICVWNHSACHVYLRRLLGVMDGWTLEWVDIIQKHHFLSSIHGFAIQQNFASQNDNERESWQKDWCFLGKISIFCLIFFSYQKGVRLEYVKYLLLITQPPGYSFILKEQQSAITYIISKQFLKVPDNLKLWTNNVCERSSHLFWIIASNFRVK